ncbi:MAG: efflux RND transporter periplasmic adaptor subunit [Verrucomicrobia bacterium]|nr:efflux RND transporter periplasmic adaptor subunit [Verrucomicrobiota bacterium]
MRNTNKMVLTAASVVAGLGLAGSAMADFDGYYTFNAGGTFFSAQTPISGSPWYLGNTAGGATGMKGVSGAGTSLGTFNPAPSGSLFLFGSGPGGGTGIPGTIEAWVTIDPSIAPNTTMVFNYLSAVETLGNGGTGDAVGWFYGPNLGPLTMHQQEFDGVQSRFRVAEATVKEAEAMLGYTKVTAPFNGIVTAKRAEVGDLAAPGKPLLELEDATALRLEADVPEALLDKIKLNDKKIILSHQTAREFILSLFCLLRNDSHEYHADIAG